MCICETKLRVSATKAIAMRWVVVQRKRKSGRGMTRVVHCRVKISETARPIASGKTPLLSDIGYHIPMLQREP
jgi:hypothetical protein